MFKIFKRTCSNCALLKKSNDSTVEHLNEVIAKLNKRLDDTERDLIYYKEKWVTFQRMPK